MSQLIIKKILDIMQKNEYQVFETDTKDWNSNIVGIRNSTFRPNLFEGTFSTLLFFKK